MTTREYHKVPVVMESNGGGIAPWTLCCSDCGAVVGRTDLHDSWHDRATTVYDEVDAERKRAHKKFVNESLEDMARNSDDHGCLPVLMEEVGEVAREFNDARHEHRDLDRSKLRAELIQVAAMATAWAEGITQVQLPKEDVSRMDRQVSQMTDPYRRTERPEFPVKRLKECVAQWPECYEGGYDPRCCRFPKTCSCTVYDVARVLVEELED